MRSLTVFIFCFSFVFSQAQVDSVYTGKPVEGKRKNRDNEWMKHLTWGGNFQAWVGNPTFLFLSPTVGYVPVKNLHVGLGMIYSYSSYNYIAGGKYSMSVFGGHSYIRYIIAESYFLQTEFDKLYQPDYYATDPHSRIWINYLMVGGGFRQRISDKAALTTSIMYNLTPHVFSIYPSRLILQFGFTSSIF
jgi:hypothetical protein